MSVSEPNDDWMKEAEEAQNAVEQRKKEDEDKVVVVQEEDEDVFGEEQTSVKVEIKI